MFLCEALERKKALEESIEELKKDFKLNPINLEILSAQLDQIGNLVDETVTLDRRINDTYATVLIISDRSISDILYEIRGLEYKSKLLSLAIQKILKESIINSVELDIDIDFLIKKRAHLDGLTASLNLQIKELILKVKLR